MRDGNMNAGEELYDESMNTTNGTDCNNMKDVGEHREL